jgi:hypothetical protein
LNLSIRKQGDGMNIGIGFLVTEIGVPGEFVPVGRREMRGNTAERSPIFRRLYALVGPGPL